MHISWLRDESLSWTDANSFPGMPFSQQMTVPCLLKLRRTPDGYRVSRTPIPALDALHEGAAADIRVEEGARATLALLPQGDLRLTISAGGPVSVRAGSAGFVYDPAAGEAVFDGGRRAALQSGGDLALRVLTDTASCEFFLQDEISASYGQIMAGRALELRCAEGLTVRGRAWPMRSIWSGHED